jgi:hypothetical protein
VASEPIHEDKQEEGLSMSGIFGLRVNAGRIMVKGTVYAGTLFDNEMTLPKGVRKVKPKVCQNRLAEKFAGLVLRGSASFEVEGRRVEG